MEDIPNQPEAPSSSPNQKAPLNKYAAVAMLLVVIAAGAVLLLYGNGSGPRNNLVTTTTIKIADNTTVSSATSYLSPKNIHDGADEMNYTAEKMVNASDFSLKWNGKVTTSIGSSPAHNNTIGNFTFTASKSGKETLYTLSLWLLTNSSSPRNSIYSGASGYYDGVSKEPLTLYDNYSTSYNGTRFTSCFGSLTPSSCQISHTNDTNDLLAAQGASIYFFDYLALPLEIDQVVGTSPSVDYAFIAPWTPDAVYTFVRNTSYKSNPCALMNFTYLSVPQEVTGMFSGYPIKVTASGQTCLSDSSGLPLFTNIRIIGRNYSSSAYYGSVVGNFSIV